jgi:oxygen-dependent protoporphyrinogen oxidase
LADIEPDGDGWMTTQQYDRYFFYPDHLVRLPRIPGASDPAGTIQALAGLVADVFREPLYDGMPAFMWNMLRPSADGQAPTSFEDVSIGDEFLRRGGVRAPVDNMLSAMCHGIYGGDVWKLSAESSIFGTAFANNRLRVKYEHPLQKWTDRRVPVLRQDRDMLEQTEYNDAITAYLSDSQRIKGINFGAGFGALTDALVEKLRANKNVKFVDERVSKLRLDATGRVEVTTPKQALQYDKVVSSLYSKTLASLAPRDALPSLASSTAVTIRLVNLWSPTPNLNHKTKGFGYLIPQTVPAEQNPHAALGVIFDSDRTSQEDDLPPTEPAQLHPAPTGDTVPGTKLTVMLGGHHWDDIPAGFLPEAATDDDAAIQAAKETVRIQMGIPPDAWTATSTKLCVDCIPQHLVGHTRRMAAADDELRRAFNGKLAVVGGSYTAPGVVGSVRAARDVAWQAAGKFWKWKKTAGLSGGVVDQPVEAPWTVGETGLARFVGGTARHWHATSPLPLKRVRNM